MRLGVSILGILATSFASAADPIRAFVMGDGRVRLWLKGAPTLTASPQGGWAISPAGKEKDKTWLERLKKVPHGEGSVWQVLLDGVSQEQPPAGVVILQTKATLDLEPGADGTVTVRAADTMGNRKQAAFRKSSGAWTSDNAANIETFVAKAVGCSGAALTTAMAHAVGGNSSNSLWSSFISSEMNKPSPVLIDASSGSSVIDVRVVSPSVPTASATGSNPSSGPKTTEPKASAGKPEDSSGGFPWLPVVLTGLVGLGAGFGLRPFMLRSGPKGPTKEDLAALTARLTKTEEQLSKSRSELEQTKKAAQQYRNEQGAWERDRNETLKAIGDERAAHAKARTHAEGLATALRQSQAEHQRDRAELGRHLEALQAVSQRARAYGDLQKEVAEAFNYVQSEIGRPETAAAVGYLLNYSCAQLLESLAKPNPVLEKAMLANVDRIASSFNATPHAKKVASTAQRLGAALGAGKIPESAQAHAHARHFDEILRLLRHQRGLELSPFYFGSDGSGAVHAVYV